MLGKMILNEAQANDVYYSNFNYFNFHDISPFVEDIVSSSKDWLEEKGYLPMVRGEVKPKEPSEKGEAMMESMTAFSEGAMMEEAPMMMEGGDEEMEARVEKLEYLYTRRKDVKSDKKLGEFDPEIGDIRVRW